MPSNLDKLHSELKRLISTGNSLQNAMQLECHADRVRVIVEQQLKEAKKPHNKAAVDAYLKQFPDFRSTYQAWYSTAYVVMKQLLPDRLIDFASMYAIPKNRKSLEWSNYVIADYLQGLSSTRHNGPGPSAAIPQMQQQVNILKACEERFKSSLFDMKQLVQADLFDSELDAAGELAKHKFLRAAGAVAGVVLEKHLNQVCENHSIKIGKTNPGISTFNDALKDSGTIDVPQWRAIQHLGDLRNLCDHNKKKEPTDEQISDLIAGVAKVIKNVF